MSYSQQFFNLNQRAAKKTPLNRNSLWRKSFILIVLGIMGLLQCSDILDPTAPTAPSGSDIRFTLNTTGVATPSSPYTLSGTVYSNKGLDSITVQAFDPDGNYFGSGIVKKLFAATSYDLYNSLYRLSVNTSNCNGVYTVTIHAFSKGSVLSKSVAITVSNAKECSVVNTPSLTMGAISGNTSVTPNTPAVLTGTITCTNCLGSTVVSATVKDSSGAPVTNNSVAAVVTPTTSGYSITITALNSACDGKYTISVTAINGILTKTATKLITVSGATDCSAPSGDLYISGVLTLGAQNAQKGSSLDIDQFRVLTIDKAKSQNTTVDLIAGYSTSDKIMMFGSPKWARDNSLAVAAGWTSYNTTQFKSLTQKIDLKSATQLQLKTLWNNTSITAQNISLATGQQYLTVTSQGAVAVIDIISLSHAINGNISIQVGHTAANVVSAPPPFVPEGLVESEVLIVGADENTKLGSSIDLDEPVVMFSNAAKTAASEIDLIYVYTFAGDEDVFGSPVWANASGFPFVSGWSTYNNTKFYKIDGAVFENITTKEQLEDLWQETLAIDPSVPVTRNSVVIAKTNKGTLALIKVFSHVPGATGQIEIKVAQ